jgi:hypothetical protein
MDAATKPLTSSDHSTRAHTQVLANPQAPHQLRGIAVGDVIVETIDGRKSANSSSTDSCKRIGSGEAQRGRSGEQWCPGWC